MRHHGPATAIDHRSVGNPLTTPESVSPTIHYYPSLTSHRALAPCHMVHLAGVREHEGEL